MMYKKFSDGENTYDWWIQNALKVEKEINNNLRYHKGYDVAKSMIAISSGSTWARENLKYLEYENQAEISSFNNYSDASKNDYDMEDMRNAGVYSKK